MKHRLTKEQRAKVRGTLVKWLHDCAGLDLDTATRAVTHGSPCMADAIGRRIANGPGYAETREITPEMFNLAFGGWIAYKCGLRDEAAPDTADEDETPAEPAATIVLSGAMHDCGELAPEPNGAEPVAVECDRLAAAM